MCGAVGALGRCSLEVASFCLLNLYSLEQRLEVASTETLPTDTALSRGVDIYFLLSYSETSINRPTLNGRFREVVDLGS